MSLFNWPKQLGRKSRCKNSASTRRAYLEIESLEDRIVPVIGAGSSLPQAVLPGNGMDGVVRVGGASGSLLYTGRHVLTAAHVVDTNGDRIGDNGGKFRVTFDLPSGPVDIWSTKVFLPSQYTGNWADGYDIAVLELSGVAPASADRYDIYRSSSELSHNFTIVGYGETGMNNSVISGSGGTKRFGENKVDGIDAARAFSRFDFDDGSEANNSLGLRYKTIHESLNGYGDSGGPNFFNNLIAGVTSNVADVSFKAGTIGQSTRVSAVASWIDGILDNPATATLIGPSGTTTDTTPTFRWNAAQGASWYRVYVLNTATNRVVIDKWVQSTTSYTAPSALTEGNYRFWVQSYGNGKYGDWSSPLNFSIQPVKPATSFLIGPNGSTSDRTPTFQWYAAKGATWYRVYVFNYTTNTRVIDQWVTSTSYTPSVNLSSGTYAFWVQTWGDGQYGGWSAPLQFVIV